MAVNKKTIRTVLAIIVLAATVGAFAYYITHHPTTITQLRELPLQTILLLLGLYVLFMVALAWIQRATLSLCGLRLPRGESFLLMSYSSIINFFGPLQSGPAFRAAYLKKKYDVNLKSYTLATLCYYGFYAAFSGLFILTYWIGLYALAGIIFIIVASPFILRNPSIQRRLPERFRKLQLQHIGTLAAATIAQVSIFAVIFYVELNSLGNRVAAIPALIYTGAANLALFVSVTPAAIGFREAFVLFTQNLHHISNDVIVTASLIDRGVYVLFLGLLAAVVFGLHAERYLKNRMR